MMQFPAATAGAIFPIAFSNQLLAPNSYSAQISPSINGTKIGELSARLVTEGFEFNLQFHGQMAATTPYGSYFVTTTFSSSSNERSEISYLAGLYRLIVHTELRIHAYVHG